MKTPTIKILLLLAFLLPACGKTETPIPTANPATPSNPATPAPNANAPVSSHTFKTADGPELTSIQNQQMLHPQFELTPDEVDSPVIFGVVQNDEKHTSSPILLKKFGDKWRVVELGEVPDQEWVYAAACPERGEIWGILDAAGRPPAHQLLLLRSTDSGATWQYFAAVRKISPNANYAGFSLAKSGEARLTMHLEEDEDSILKGYYHYSTTDGGKTWTGPTHESDDVVEADPLARFDTIQEAIKVTESEDKPPTTPQPAPKQ